MERLYLRRASVLYCVLGLALVAITLIIPCGVFMRYVMNPASSGPSRVAVLVMVLFSFVGGAAAYRANAQIAVRDADRRGRRAPARGDAVGLADLVMVATARSCSVYGTQLCGSTWGNTIAEFPTLSVGVTYLPIPIGGLLTLLFIVERIWLGEPPQGRSVDVQRPAARTGMTRRA